MIEGRFFGDWILMNDAFAITQEHLKISHEMTNALLLQALKDDLIKSKGDPVYLGGQFRGYKNIHFNTNTWLSWLATQAPKQ